MNPNKDVRDLSGGDCDTLESQPHIEEMNARIEEVDYKDTHGC